MAGMLEPHDIGGKRGGGNETGPVPRGEHVFASWERRADAMNRLLGGAGKRIYILDELRRTIELLSPEAYFSLSYYERWIRALEMPLNEKGVLTRDEIDGRSAALPGV